jgi:hypothetical protein
MLMLVMSSLLLLLMLLMLLLMLRASFRGLAIAMRRRPLRLLARHLGRRPSLTKHGLSSAASPPPVPHIS